MRRIWRRCGRSWGGKRLRGRKRGPRSQSPVWGMSGRRTTVRPLVSRAPSREATWGAWMSRAPSGSLVEFGRTPDSCEASSMLRSASQRRRTHLALESLTGMVASLLPPLFMTRPHLNRESNCQEETKEGRSFPKKHRKKGSASSCHCMIPLG